MVTETHGRPAGPKMNPMSPTTLMRVAGSFDVEVGDAYVAPSEDSPGTVAANAKAEAVAKRRTANEKARVAKDAARVADELATLAREAKRKAEELLGGSFDLGADHVSQLVPAEASGPPTLWEGACGGDARMRCLVPQLATEMAKGGPSWGIVATHLPGRSGRECRDRWLELCRSEQAFA